MTRGLVAQFKRFRYQQAGLTNSEYAVILSLLIAVIMTVLPPLATHMNKAFAGVQLEPQTTLVNAETSLKSDHVRTTHGFLP